MTGQWYRVWGYDDRGGGKIVVTGSKEPVERREVPARYLEAEPEDEEVRRL